MWFSRLKYINIWPNLEFTSQRIPVLIGRYISIHTVLIYADLYAGALIYR